MKIAVIGSRTFTDVERMNTVLSAVARKHPNFEIISGAAKGADRLAALWGHERGHRVVEFPADWEKHGKRAGFIRNADIINAADAVVAFWDGESRGTLHSIGLAEDAGKPLKLVRFLPEHR
jgi:hypothetical protein